MSMSMKVGEGERACVARFCLYTWSWRIFAIAITIADVDSEDELGCSRRVSPYSKGISHQAAHGNFRYFVLEYELLGDT